ncbi:hypothetical protein [Paenibacillus sp. FJAT-26967]|uniref:hypothetical protein n=1 Tax=Paenibacillus sp. FJAT-26967 TaxID=1729690 RepID=UPI000837B805|nr:hypothetical protein [Paenibacillus sp. FJAT-26967]
MPRFISITFLILVALTGCSWANKTITLEQVVSAIQKEGIELVSEEVGPNRILVNVQPQLFSLSNSGDKTIKEYIYIYIYDTEKNAKQAEIDQQFDTTAATFLYNYRHKNTLIVYSSQKKNDRHNEQIEAVLKKL